MKYTDINLETRECERIEPDPNHPGYMKVFFASKRRPGFLHSEWYKTTEFVRNNPDLASLATSSAQLPKDEVGVVSKATDRSLSDRSKDWTVNEFIGYTLWISRGKGEGQTRLVAANTATRIELQAPFAVIPDTSSQYMITVHVHDPQPLGNTLPASLIKKAAAKVVV